jgi:hypothetical protein
VRKDYWTSHNDRLISGISSIPTNGECFWLYDATHVDGGECRSRTDSNLRCLDVTNISQCADGLVDTTLEDKCFIYNNLCDWKCEYIIAEVTCSGRADCFFLLGNDSESSPQNQNKCVNKVYNKKRGKNK